MFLIVVVVCVILICVSHGSCVPYLTVTNAESWSVFRKSQWFLLETSSEMSPLNSTSSTQVLLCHAWSYYIPHTRFLHKCKNTIDKFLIYLWNSFLILKSLEAHTWHRRPVRIQYCISFCKAIIPLLFVWSDYLKHKVTVVRSFFVLVNLVWFQNGSVVDALHVHICTVSTLSD